jgi:hypothetical protein
MTHGGTDKARWKGVGVVLPTLKWKRRARLAGTAGGRRVLVGRQMVRVGARGGDERYTGGLAGQVEGVGVAIEAVLHTSRPAPTRSHASW